MRENRKVTWTVFGLPDQVFGSALILGRWNRFYSGILADPVTVLTWSLYRSGHCCGGKIGKSWGFPATKTRNTL